MRKVTGTIAMRTSQIRRCTLLDVMVLVAATATGFAIARTYSLELLANQLTHYPLLPRILLTIWSYLVAVLPLPVMWSIGLFVLSLRRPRPLLRRLVRQPGFVACGAVTLVAAIRLLGFFTLLARTIGNPRHFLTMSLDVFLNFSLTLVFNSAYFSTSAFGLSVAVASAWLLLSVSGLWRSEPTWLDRAGRCLGVYWIAIIPLSCWWDYHMLY
jgi:hypothetical protein